MKANRVFVVAAAALTLLILAMAIMPSVSATPAKAYIQLYSPTSSREVDVGTQVNTLIMVKNSGTDEAAIGAWITGTSGVGEICFKQDYFGGEGGVGCSGNFIMPNKVVNVKFHALRGSGSIWLYDHVVSLTLTPKTTPQEGKFKIRALNKDTLAPITAATVTVTGIGTKNTGSDGMTGWFYADFGTYLIVNINAAGYASFNTGDTFYEGDDGMIWAHHLRPTAPTPTPQPLCEPHKLRCEGNTLEKCNWGGTDWLFLKTCTYGCTCSPQPCHCEVAPTPTPTVSPTPGPTPTPTPDGCVSGDHRCVGDWLQVCQNNQWQDEEYCDWGCDRAKKDCTQLQGFGAAAGGAGFLAVAFLLMRRRRGDIK